MNLWAKVRCRLRRLLASSYRRLCDSPLRTLGARRLVAAALARTLAAARLQRLPWSWWLAERLYLCKQLLPMIVGWQPWPRTWRQWQQWRQQGRSQWLAKLELWSRGPVTPDDDFYATYRRHNQLSLAEAARMRLLADSFVYRPLISILVPLYNTRPEWLQRLYQSVQQQTYPRWELVLVDDGSSDPDTQAELQRWQRDILSHEPRVQMARRPQRQGIAAATNHAAALARGSFFAFLDHDDELYPDALWWLVDSIQREPDCQLLYTDEEVVPLSGGHPIPCFKPGFSPELLTAYNYICHLVCVRRDVFESVGGFRSEFDGAQDYDFLLRICQPQSNQLNQPPLHVVHVPRVLYRWHVVPSSRSRYVNPHRQTLEPVADIQPLTQRLLQTHFDAWQWQATATMVGPWCRPSFAPVDRGQVSIILCTRNQPRLLRQAVQSIERMTHYPNWELCIVDNGSTCRTTRQLLQTLARRHRVVSMPNGPDGFNFASLNNRAASLVTGTYLCFLNDDIRILSSQWLDALVGYAQRPGVGAVGARLLYPDGRLQHAGVIVGAMGWGPWHALLGMPAQSDIAGGYMTYPHNALAVTGACLLTRRDLFLAMAGFDESAFPVNYNDVDYCLRLAKQGRRCVVAPQAELIHYASQSRDPRVPPAEAVALRHRWENTNDPYWNINLGRENPYFAPRRRRHARRLWASFRPTVGYLSAAACPANASSDWLPHLPTLFALLQERHVCTAKDLLAPDTALAASGQVNELELRHRVRQWAATAASGAVLAVQGMSMVAAVEEAKTCQIPCLWHIPTALQIPEPFSPAALRHFWRVRRALRYPYQVLYNNPKSMHRAYAGHAYPTFGLVEEAVLAALPTQTEQLQARQRCRDRLAIPATAVCWLVEVDLGAATNQLFKFIWQIFHQLLQQPQLSDWRLLVLVRQAAVKEGLRERCWRDLRAFGQRALVVLGPERRNDYFAAADGYVACPTDNYRPEGTLRAMLFGLPIIGPEVLTRSNTLAPDFTGRQTIAWQADSYVRALVELQQNHQARQQAGQNARLWLESRTQPSQVLAEWTQLVWEAAEIGQLHQTNQSQTHSALSETPESGRSVESVGLMGKSVTPPNLLARPKARAG